MNETESVSIVSLQQQQSMKNTTNKHWHTENFTIPPGYKYATLLRSIILDF